MNFAHTLVSDLLNVRYQMLFKNGKPPKRVTAIAGPQVSRAVMTGRERIANAIVADLGKDGFESHVVSEFTYEKETMPLDQDSLYLWLQYEEEAPRLLLLTLMENEASIRLH